MSSASEITDEILARADGGDARLQLAVGVAFVKGRRVPRDVQRGVEYLQKAAAAGCKDAAFYATYVKATQKNIEFLAEMKTLAQSGYHPAMNELGNVYWSGWVLQENRRRAAVYFRRAARAGSATASLKVLTLPLHQPFASDYSFFMRVLIAIRVFFQRIPLAFKVVEEREKGHMRR